MLSKFTTLFELCHKAFPARNPLPDGIARTGRRTFPKSSKSIFDFSGDLSLA
jgi:hypothetical protein